MNIFVAIASSHMQYVGGLLSCTEVDREDGDKFFIQHGSHGYMARNELGTEFLDKPNYDAILLLDADMRHSEDALAKLRAHNLDIVVGHYFKRQTDPMQSALLALNPDMFWPCFPLMDIPDSGLVEVGAGGFGIALLSRKVVEEVCTYLGGPNELFMNGKVPGLEREGVFGSDVRFFLAARQLGYTVWMDAGVESLHATTAWLGRQLYGKIRDDLKLIGGTLGILAHDVEENGVSLEAFKARKNLLEQYRAALIRDKLEPAKTAGDDKNLAHWSVQLYKMDARIEEMYDWITWWEKYPRIDSPGLLPQVETEQDLQLALQNRRGAPGVAAPEKAQAQRRGVYQRQSEDFVDELQKHGDGGSSDETVRPDRSGSGGGGSEGQGPELREPDGGEPPAGRPD